MNSYGIWEALGTDEPVILWVFGKYCNVCGYRHQWVSEHRAWCSNRFSDFQLCPHCSSQALKALRVYRITDEQRFSRSTASEKRLVTALKLARRRYNDEQRATRKGLD